MTKIKNYYIESLAQDLINYYKEKGLVIVGLNDSQGVNVNTTLFKKGMLEYIASLLKSEELDPIVINAFSLLFNKTEHIDYFLKNNLSVEQIKESQSYSAVEAMRKIMYDFHMPEALGNLATVSKIVYPVKNGDRDTYITTALKEAIEPTVIYSSGVNNLMREIGNNPAKIVRDYKKRDVSPNYDYSVNQAKNPECLNRVIDGIERNFESILAINGNTDIYTLGAYIPKVLRREDIDSVFRELILEYNARLLDLCTAYNIRYINTEKFLGAYNKSEVNFHVTTEGHNALANHLLEAMHSRKICSSITSDGIVTNPFDVKDEGPTGMLADIYSDVDASYKKELSIMDMDSYEFKRACQISAEREREERVFQKIYRNEYRRKGC